jgi:general L-amino acid transport system permease protein
VAGWLRCNLFSSWASSLVTLALGASAVYLLTGLVEWGLVKAVFLPDAERCRALDGAGACWGVIAEKHRLVLFGRYPFGEQWRPALATALAVSLLVATAVGRWRARHLAAAWLIGAATCLGLLRGGFAGLAPVGSEHWGGFPLTLLLSIGALAGALPLGILLALGRTSPLPVLRTACGAYVELIRALPLIPVLFMAAFLFPLLLPRDMGGDVLLRVLLALVLFAAAYLAEVVRGGLQSVPAAQYETARALGLGYWQIHRHVVLPQALRAALPALTNSFVALFKDVSLVTVVSLYELTGSLTLALGGDADWRPYFLEGYLFIGLIYWSGCFALSRWSARLERR